MKFSSCYNKGNMKKTSFLVEVIVCCIFTNPCSVPDMANIRNDFLSKDELDDYRASLSYYNSQYLELLAMLNTEQSVLFKKLQDNRSDIIGLERDASFRCGLCVGLKLGSLSSLLLSSMRRAKQCRYFASSLPPGYRHSRLTIVRRGCCQVATRRDSWRSHVHRT